MRNVIAATLVVFALAFVPQAGIAQELQVGANDSVQSVLAGQKGKRVSVRVRSGQEITGLVREVGSRVVHLGAISGKEFFDAVVPLEAIDAIMVRTRTQ